MCVRDQMFHIEVKLSSRSKSASLEQFCRLWLWLRL